MGDTNRQSIGKKKPILSAKTARHTCGRPFKASRAVVQIITETAKDRDIAGRQEEADEVATHGEVSVMKESAMSVVKDTEVQDTTSDSDDGHNHWLCLCRCLCRCLCLCLCLCHCLCPCLCVVSCRVVSRLVLFCLSLLRSGFGFVGSGILFLSVLVLVGLALSVGGWY